jgi:hypothetical protein
MHRAALVSFLAGRDAVSRRPGYFGVYGGDFVITLDPPEREREREGERERESGRERERESGGATAHLLEWNFSPQMGGVSATFGDEHFGTVLWRSALEIVELVRERERGSISASSFCLSLSQRRGLFTPLLDEVCDGHRPLVLDDDDIVDVLL